MRIKHGWKAGVTFVLTGAMAASALGAGQGQRPPGISGENSQLVPPIRIFDNLYYVGTDFVSAYIVTTGDGLIMIDTLHDGFTAETLASMRTIGLDPAGIRHVIVTHGHQDHYGGAQLVDEIADTSVAMTAADWALFEAAESRRKEDAFARPVVIADGDTLTLGEATFRFYITPGHTPGVASMEFSVFEGGAEYKAFLFGGHNVTTNQVAAFEMFIESVHRLRAALSGVHVNLTSHPWAAWILERGERLAARQPGEPHPYVSPAEFEAFLEERLTDAQTRLAAARAEQP